MDVEALMGLANRACRDTFSRPVTYTPVGGPAVSTLSDGETPLKGEWVPTPSGIGPASPLGDSDDPALKILMEDMADVGITPNIEGDKVTLVVFDEPRTYRVTKAVPDDVGDWHLALGQRS